MPDAFPAHRLPAVLAVAPGILSAVAVQPLDLSSFRLKDTILDFSH